jgi:hypothetical protein
VEINRLIQSTKGTQPELMQWPKLITFLVDSSSNQQPCFSDAPKKTARVAGWALLH